MTQTDSDPRSDPRPRRRWRWWNTVPIFLCLIVVAFILYHIALDRAIEAELEAIRADGLPATFEELDAWYEHVPDSENAALVWLDAFGLLRNPTDRAEYERTPIIGFRSPDLAHPWDRHTPDQIDLMRKHLELNGPAIARAKEAARLNSSRFPIDLTEGVEAFLNSDSTPGEHRQMSRTLLIEALVAVQDRRPDPERPIVTLFALADSLQREPVLISQLNRLAEQSLAIDAIEHALNHLDFDAPALQNLSDSLGRTMRVPTLHTGLIGERVFQGTFLSESFGGSAPEERTAAVLGRATGFFQQNELQSLRFIRVLIEAQNLPSHERLAVAHSVEREVESLGWTGVIAKTMISSLTRMQEIELRSVARLHGAQAALAVERYRLVHENQPPDSLDRLVPDYIDAVPLDPFDGKPLRYVKTAASHYTVYSVGEDLTDHGGTRHDASGDEYTPDTDIVFEVRRATPTPSTLAPAFADPAANTAAPESVPATAP